MNQTSRELSTCNVITFLKTNLQCFKSKVNAYSKELTICFVTFETSACASLMYFNLCRQLGDFAVHMKWFFYLTLVCKVPCKFLFLVTLSDSHKTATRTEPLHKRVLTNRCILFTNLLLCLKSEWCLILDSDDNKKVWNPSLTSKTSDSYAF